MRYRLRTLLILLAVLPPILAWFVIAASYVAAERRSAKLLRDTLRDEDKTIVKPANSPNGITLP